MIKSLRKLLKKIHHAIPLKVRNIYMPVLSRWLYLFHYHLNAAFPLIVLYEGRELKDGHPLSFAYAGTLHGMNNYWDHLILKNGFKKRHFGRHFFGNIRSKLNKIAPDCGLMFLEESSLTIPFLNQTQGFSIPVLIQMEIDISAPFDELFDSKRRADIKRCNSKNLLSYEMSQDPKDFENFHSRMYAPYINKRYTDAAAISSYESIQKTIPTSEIILIKADEIVIAGAMVELIKNQPPFLRHLGVVDANETYVRYGAIGAIYYFLIEELKKRGYDLLRIGGTRPLLSDGLTTFKLSFRPRLCKVNKHSCVRLLVLNDSPSVKNFLTNNPFLYKNQNKEICRALFVDATHELTAKNLSDSLKSSYCEGIKETHIYVFGNKSLPEGLDAASQRINIHRAEKMINK